MLVEATFAQWLVHDFLSYALFSPECRIHANCEVGASTGKGSHRRNNAMTFLFQGGALYAPLQLTLTKIHTFTCTNHDPLGRAKKTYLAAFFAPCCRWYCYTNIFLMAYLREMYSVPVTR